MWFLRQRQMWIRVSLGTGRVPLACRGAAFGAGTPGAGADCARRKVGRADALGEASAGRLACEPSTGELRGARGSAIQQTPKW